ncbi:MAG: ArsR/SmtB family transcription factor [Halobacteriota archaeon]
MTQAPDRIHRLLEDELGECRPEDVETRLREIQHLADRAFKEDPARRAFAVLGDETRYRLARALTVSGEELCVCELERLVDVSESAVSHALSDLVEAGLVGRRKERTWRYYRSTELANALFATADRQVVADA